MGYKIIMPSHCRCPLVTFVGHMKVISATENLFRANILKWKKTSYDNPGQFFLGNPD